MNRPAASAVPSSRRTLRARGNRYIRSDARISQYHGRIYWSRLRIPIQFSLHRVGEDSDDGRSFNVRRPNGFFDLADKIVIKTDADRMHLLSRGDKNAGMV